MLVMLPAALEEMLKYQRVMGIVVGISSSALGMEMHKVAVS